MRKKIREMSMTGMSMDRGNNRKALLHAAAFALTAFLTAGAGICGIGTVSAYAYSGEPAPSAAADISSDEVTVSSAAVQGQGTKEGNKVRDFHPILQEETLTLTRKDPGTLSLITQDHPVGKLHVTGEGIGQLSFVSSNPAVAAVSADGTVQATGGGAAQIIVTAQSVSGEKAVMSAWVYVRDETRIQTDRHEYAPANYTFDEGKAINDAGILYKSTAFTTPGVLSQKDTAGIRVEDQEGADGVTLVRALDQNNHTDYYLNAFVAGHTLRLAVPANAVVENLLPDGSKGAAERLDNGDYLVTMEAFPANNTASAPEQTIRITAEGRTRIIHTRPETFPIITSYKSAKEPTEAGVYTFTVDQYLLRVNTDRMIVYYRNVACVNDHAGVELRVKNFRAQDAVEDGRRYYTFFIELDPAKRNLYGGFLSGMQVIMDQNYREIQYVTLLPNKAKHHGEGYVDQHEFCLLGEDHWLSVSYIEAKVDNIPACVPTREGKGEAFVQAGIIQEVKDGKVIAEFATTDYPVFYETSMEACDYVNSTDQGTEVALVSGGTAFSRSDGFMDYVHINSICIDPADGNLIVSMRNQYSVYKIDRKTGRILWTLGGLNDDFGLKTEEQFIGQHYAYLEETPETGTAVPTLMILDNHTSYEANLTRVAEIQFDKGENKVLSKHYYHGVSLDPLSKEIGVQEVVDPATGRKTMPMHWSTHCGSAAREPSGSILIGWGLHGNYLGVTKEPLIPIFTEYNPVTNTIDFELYLVRNEHYTSGEAKFSYRVYKNAF